MKRFMDPQSNDIGDVHFYNYNIDCLQEKGYPHARFVSEHGFITVPS